MRPLDEDKNQRTMRSLNFGYKSAIGFRRCARAWFASSMLIAITHAMAQVPGFTEGPAGTLVEPTMPVTLGGPGNNNLSLVASTLAGPAVGDVMVGVGLNPLIPPTKLPMRVLRAGTGGVMSDATRMLFGSGVLPSAAGPRVLYKYDLNGDGRLDLFCACQGYDGSPPDGETNILLTQNANGTFTDRSSALPAQPDYTHSAAIADINGDGIPDIYVGNISNSTATGAYFLLGRADGGYDKVSNNLPADITVQTLPNSKLFTTSMMIDVDQDGFPDLVLGAEGNTTQASIVLFNNGTGDFTVRPRYVLPTGPLGNNYVALNLQTIDANDDGYPDILMTSTQFTPNYVGGSIQLLINQQNGTFVDETVARLSASATTITGIGWNNTQVIDINGDGKPDFISSTEFGIAGTESSAFLWINNGSGQFTPFSASVLTPRPIGKLTATDIDGDGRPDLVAVQFNNDGHLQYQTYLNRTAQSITFSPIADRPLTSTAFALTASASSGFAVIFNSNTPAVCRISGSVVSLVNSGTCSIAANQPGNATFGAAPTVTQSFQVGAPAGGWLVQSGGFNPLVLNGAVSVGSFYEWGAGITNIGSAPVSLGGASLTGPFGSLNAGGCGPSLAAGASCFIGFRFTPTVDGQASGSLVVNNNGGNNPFVLDLQSAGTTAFVAPAHVASFVPATAPDGGTTLFTHTFSNPNGAPLTGALAVANLPPGLVIATPLAAVTNCGGAWQGNPAGQTNAVFSGGTIPANSSCSISLAVTANGAVGTTHTAYTLPLSTNQVFANPVIPATLAIVSAPSAPRNVFAFPGNARATIRFDAPASNGGAAITGYRINCSPGGITTDGGNSPIVVTGLASETAYSCSVQALTAAGAGAASPPVSVTPSATAPLALVVVQSRKVHGAAGTFALTIDPSIEIDGAVTIEPRAMGSGHMVAFVFSDLVTATASSSIRNAAMTPVGTFDLTLSGHEARFRVTDIADNSRTRFTLTGINGVLDAAAAIGFLVGDVNGSRNVSAADISGIKTRADQPIDASNFRFDLNASGGISTGDISMVRLRSGLALP